MTLTGFLIIMFAVMCLCAYIFIKSMREMTDEVNYWDKQLKQAREKNHEEIRS